MMKRLHSNRVAIWLLAALLACTSGYTQESVKVYVTDTGSKYHVKDCRYLRYSDHERTLTEARAQGYTACKVCKPGSGTREHLAIEDSIAVSKARTEASPTSETSRPSVTSRQCSATTQKGTRCKRTTTSASGKCWQHEP